MARRPLPVLLGAAGCGVFGALVWVAAFHVDRAQWADAAALHGFTRLAHTRVGTFAEGFASLADPLPFAVLGGLIVLLALRFRGPRVAAVIPLILLTANLATQFLKPALAAARPYLEAADHVDSAAWPSGHSTAAMSLALCAVLAAPAGYRAAAAIAGAVYAMGVAYSVVLLSWHFPSDALGGFAVAGATTCLGVAALRAADRRWPARTARAVAARAVGHAGPVVVAGALVAALGAAAAGAKVLLLVGDDDLRLAFLAGAAGIAGLALALVAALAASLRG
jgi:membrane-associated phospholipid phosphatase